MCDGIRLRVSDGFLKCVCPHRLVTATRLCPVGRRVGAVSWRAASDPIPANLQVVVTPDNGNPHRDLDPEVQQILVQFAKDFLDRFGCAPPLTALASLATLLGQIEPGIRGLAS